MVAGSASNLGAVVDMLMLGISLEDIAVPPAAAEYARRFAQHLRSTRGNNPGAGTSGQPTSASINQLDRTCERPSTTAPPTTRSWWRGMPRRRWAPPRTGRD
jgi:hypothetical protein